MGGFFFPNLLLRKRIERLSFLILKYTIVFSSSHDSTNLYFDPIFLRNRFHFDLQMIFAGAVVQLHVTCGDHCFARFSSKNMIIFFYGKEEPSKICSDLNEWRLSLVG